MQAEAMACDQAGADIVRGGKNQAAMAGKNTYHVECVGPDGKIKWEEPIGNIIPDAGLNDVLDKYLKGSTYTASFFVGLVTGEQGSITAATQANPGQITSAGHGRSTGDKVKISSVSGMTELNGNTYTITVVDANNFTIGVDTTGFTAYTSGGTWQLVPGVAADTMSSHAGWTEVTAYDEATREALTLGTVSGQSVDNSASKASFSINADSTVIGGCFVATNNTKGGTTGVLYSIGAFTGGNKQADNGDTLNVTWTGTMAAA